LRKLRFTPTAWAKLLTFMDMSDTEVSVFGVAEDPEDLLLVTDVALLKQEVTQVTVELDDDAVAEHIEQYAETGVQPVQCARIWIHTHPMFSTKPSHVDETTFKKAFGGCDWAIMLIVSQADKPYCRLRMQTPLGPISQEIEVEVDLRTHFPGTKHDQWEEEFVDKVTEIMSFPTRTKWPERTKNADRKQYAPARGEADLAEAHTLLGDLDTDELNDRLGDWDWGNW